MTDIKSEIEVLEKKLKKEKDEEKQLRIWKEIGYLERKMLGRL